MKLLKINKVVTLTNKGTFTIESSLSSYLSVDGPYQVMEQCVTRLDVAMFNAILRESDDAIPTDPMSDPIGDSKVLPIPTSELSFGAGAQLKNGVSNNTALLYICIFCSFCCCFVKVCPTFSASMIKHILSRFLPDEFCPDPIPDAVLQALESEKIETKHASSSSIRYQLLQEVWRDDD
ncbi:hypothetical protein B296_00011933 [Ensete ventricosum]|uniref:Uncharacterized protein n=1 Tax=Ensete ventricosum TaxID=4639 RepID=A0A427B231_ENSVE|nr:hypothetical protein B296_00011933 [Ensete ventricosum]